MRRGLLGSAQDAESSNRFCNSQVGGNMAEAKTVNEGSYLL